MPKKISDQLSTSNYASYLSVIRCATLIMSAEFPFCPERRQINTCRNPQRKDKGWQDNEKALPY